MTKSTKIILSTIVLVLILLLGGYFTIGELKSETITGSDSSTAITNQISDSSYNNDSMMTQIDTNKIDTVFSFYDEGGASWYGSNGVVGIRHTDGYHGKTTASGIRFDTHSRMAAHKTLPFGTLLRVTNKRNGKSTIVEIVDRGPYHGGRIIDLSWFSKTELDMGGTANITLEKIVLYKNGQEIAPTNTYITLKKYRK